MCVPLRPIAQPSPLQMNAIVPFASRHNTHQHTKFDIIRFDQILVEYSAMSTLTAGFVPPLVSYAGAGSGRHHMSCKSTRHNCQSLSYTLQPYSYDLHQFCEFAISLSNYLRSTYQALLCDLLLLQWRLFHVLRNVRNHLEEFWMVTSTRHERGINKASQLTLDLHTYL
jgi:hypothetical protein